VEGTKIGSTSDFLFKMYYIARVVNLPNVLRPPPWERYKIGYLYSEAASAYILAA
jgi:hypothetical protein